MDKNSKYKIIKQAQETLGLSESATMKEIKDKFHKLCHEWHPDKCKDSKTKCIKMMQKINNAYKIIMNYCNNYEYSFKDDEIKKHISYEELWNIKFGDDPLWGKKI